MVGPGARLHRVIVGSDVRIPPSFSADGVVIVRADDVRQVERGEIIGENLVVPIEVSQS